MANPVEVELESTMQAVIYAINNCDSEDLWRMSDQCSDDFKASGMYIDVPSDEDPDDFTNVAFITATANGDDYDLSFEDEDGTVHTIKEVEKDHISHVFIVDDTDQYDYNGNPLSQKSMSKIFSILEEHTDGSMWYHTGWSFDNNEAAVNFIQAKKQQDFWSDRHMEIFTHDKPLPQNKALWTIDSENFHEVSGAVVWNKYKGPLD